MSQLALAELRFELVDTAQRPRISSAGQGHVRLVWPRLKLGLLEWPPLKKAKLPPFVRHPELSLGLKLAELKLCPDVALMPIGLWRRFWVALKLGLLVLALCLLGAAAVAQVWPREASAASVWRQTTELADWRLERWDETEIYIRCFRFRVTL